MSSAKKVYDFSDSARRCSIDWDAVVPPMVAAKQRSWERRQHALELRDEGLTYKEIARRIEVKTPEQARVHILKQRGLVKRKALSPVELYRASEV